MKWKYATTILFLAFIAASCTHNYYVPISPIVPLIQEQGEFHASASLGTGNEVTIRSAQVAYAPFEHLAFAFNANYLVGGELSEKEWGKGYHSELAVGYFKPLGRLGVFEGYAGYGHSVQKHSYSGGSVSNGWSKLSYNSFFLQPNIGFRHKNFEAAFSSKLSSLSFYNIHNNVSMNNIHSYYIDTIASNPNAFLFEPDFTIRCGFRQFKVMMQFSKLYFLSSQPLHFDEFNFGIGIHYSLKRKD